MGRQASVLLQVKFSDGSAHAVQVKADDLITAKGCVEELQGFMSAEHVEEARFPMMCGPNCATLTIAHPEPIFRMWDLSLPDRSQPVTSPRDLCEPFSQLIQLGHSTIENLRGIGCRRAKSAKEKACSGYRRCRR
jgi:hypothetical protein